MGTGDADCGKTGDRDGTADFVWHFGVCARGARDREKGAHRDRPSAVSRDPREASNEARPETVRGAHSLTSQRHRRKHKNEKAKNDLPV